MWLAGVALLAVLLVAGWACDEAILSPRRRRRNGQSCDAHLGYNGDGHSVRCGLPAMHAGKCPAGPPTTEER
jgi:hypothetical protein